MKKLFLWVALPLVLMSATATYAILEQLEVTEKDASSMMVRSLGMGYPAIDRAIINKARSLSTDLKVTGTRQLIQFAKDYSQTEAFRKDYKQWRSEYLNGGKKKFRLRNPMDVLNSAIDKQVDKVVGGEDNSIPEDPKQMVKKRLEKFMEVSATVDFDAALNGSRFADPRYEAKPKEWKMCFRAGKEVVAAAREEVAKWLQEL
ncbi:hypothetical protein KJS94_15550 [Flavihumibacter rivuli]|uniref:hypothetical protein n=1 Tax=Flavihumibacter rivuli TaxID=2838156 RepID=UPI001BDEDEA7|nr:hypothetical protein [Flavihumibacter rivuli]ULQ56063.1 hypothetical protein KJS94_15550 [Flavihumibacter rivuli]